VNPHCYSNDLDPKLFESRRWLIICLVFKSHYNLVPICRSTVTCKSDVCCLHEMKGKDFFAVIESSPGMASSLRNMCRKRLFKKAVKSYSVEHKRGLSDDDLVAAFHDADVDGSGSLNLNEVRRPSHASHGSKIPNVQNR
jgi:hypothetical protein